MGDRVETWITGGGTGPATRSTGVANRKQPGSPRCVDRCSLPYVMRRDFRDSSPTRLPRSDGATLLGYPQRVAPGGRQEDESLPDQRDQVSSSSTPRRADEVQEAEERRGFGGELHSVGAGRAPVGVCDETGRRRCGPDPAAYSAGASGRRRGRGIRPRFGLAAGNRAHRPRTGSFAHAASRSGVVSICRSSNSSASLSRRGPSADRRRTGRLDPPEGAVTRWPCSDRAPACGSTVIQDDLHPVAQRLGPGRLPRLLLGAELGHLLPDSPGH